MAGTQEMIRASSRGQRKISSVQSLSRVRLFATSWTAARQASLSITNSRSLLKLMSIESVMPSTHLILCHPLLLLPSIHVQYTCAKSKNTKDICLMGCSRAAFPNLLGTRGRFHGRQCFHRLRRGGVGGWFGIIQVYYIYLGLYFYYYYISSALDHQALGPRGWGPLF